MLILISTSSAFGWMLTYLKMPELVANAILGVSDNKYVIMLIMNVLLLVLGCVMDMSALILVCTPILLPIATGIGVDPVHFGAIMVLNLGIGLITPPVGGTLFVGSAVSGIKIEKLSKAMLPFYVMMVIALLIVTFCPGLVMFLPNLMMPIQ